jgi:hypothetical protein
MLDFVRHPCAIPSVKDDGSQRSRRTETPSGHPHRNRSTVPDAAWLSQQGWQDSSSRPTVLERAGRASPRGAPPPHRPLHASGRPGRPAAASSQPTTRHPPPARPASSHAASPHPRSPGAGHPGPFPPAPAPRAHTHIPYDVRVCFSRVLYSPINTKRAVRV